MIPVDLNLIVRMEEIDLTTPDEITMFTDEEHVVLDTIDFEFEQKNKVRGIYRKITIFNGNHCYQSIKDKHQRKYKYRVDIAYLNPHPFRIHNIAWKWLYIAAGLGVITAISGVIGWLTNWLGPSPGIYYTAAVIGGAAATVIALLLFAHLSHDKILFKTHFSGIKLIELVNKYPNKDEFRQFVGKFIVQIKKAKAKKAYTTSRFLAMELKELRRLRDETVVTQKQYEDAKKLIFTHESFKAGR